LATRSQQRTHFARCGDNRRPPCAHLAMRACRRTRPASGMAETLCARLPIPGVRSPGVNNFRAGPGASQIASASTYAASGATERPRTSYRSMSRATKPDDFASSTKSRKNTAPAGFFREVPHETHRRPRYCLANRGGIVGVVLAAFEIGFT
jgi:hypothetical protein